MLGWEYPPRLAGGLGKACQGLSVAMAKRETQVFFVLPTFPEHVHESHLEVMGAREVLIEAGYDLSQESFSSHSVSDSMGRSTTRGLNRGLGAVSAGAGSSFEFLRSEAQLFPYGAAPDGKITDRLEKIMSSEVIHEFGTGDEIGDLARNQVTETIFNQEYGRAQAQITKSKKSKITKIYEGTTTKVAPKTAQGAPEKSLKKTGEIYGKNLWSEIEKYTQHVRQLSETHEVDVIHAHDWMTFPAAFEFQRVTGVPVFLHVHATEYDRSGDNLNNEVFRIEREGFKKATHIFAVSKYTAGIIERLYGVHRKKISIAYNAPDDAEKSALAPPTASNAKTFRESSQVIFLGRLTFQKGPDHFLKAAALVLQARPESKIVFCGKGDMLDKLRSQAHRLGIEPSVHFAGFVDPSQVDEILIHSKVLVMPSVSEPFGLVALEALRCGIPVILSKQSGVREVLHRALQVDFWDHEKLADQIIAALTLPKLSLQLVEEGMDQIQKLSWDGTAEKVIDIYRSYIGSTYSQSIEGAHGH